MFSDSYLAALSTLSFIWLHGKYNDEKKKQINNFVAKQIYNIAHTQGYDIN